MQTGRFTFHVNSTEGSMVWTTLQFETGSGTDTSGKHSFHVEWRSEQISSFITQLGFQDQGEDQDMDQQIKAFLLINEVN